MAATWGSPFGDLSLSMDNSLWGKPAQQQGFDWKSAAAPIGGIVGSLWGKASPPPGYSSPSFGQFTPNFFNVTGSPLYSLLNTEIQSGPANGQLPDSYINALRNRSNQGLGLARDRANQAAVFDANKYNLLGSGSMAVRQSLNDEEYQRGMANLESDLITKEFENRNQQQQLRNQQMQMVQGLLGLQTQTSARENELAWQAQQAANQYAQNQAQLQYQSEMEKWNASRAQDKGLLQNIASLAGLFF